MEMIVYKGIPVSSGIGMGEIYALNQIVYEINRGTISEAEVENELKKLELAISRTHTEYYDLKANLKDRLDEQEKFIFETYREILEDRYFIQEIKDIIRSTKCYAESAVDTCMKIYIKAIEESGNEHAKQRVYDLNDISLKIIRNIIGQEKLFPDKINNSKIVVLKELTPSLAAILGKRNVLGVIAEEGAGFLSHAAIILRGLGIPLINDIGFEEVKKFERSFAIIDGYEGKLILNPKKPEVEKYKQIFMNNADRLKELCNQKNEPAVTTDGHKICISANIGSIEECNIAANKNVDGIGLVRTEILFINNKTMPDEKEQYGVYSEIAKKMENKPVKIRTMDIGGDKTIQCMSDGVTESSSAVRGIKCLLTQKDYFITHIRSIIRAAQFGDISIMFPMVNDGEEIRQVKSLINDVLECLPDEEKRKIKNLKIGAVVETLDGVNNIDDILAEVDFISIGTNDLLQQIMELDRKNSIGGIQEYLHPVFLKTLHRCISKANQQKKFVSVCGEMAADPMASIILIGLGANDLSMSPFRTLRIKGVIRKTSMREAKELASRALKSINKDYIKRMMTDWMNSKNV